MIQLSGSKNAHIAKFAENHTSFDLLNHDFFAKERRRDAGDTATAESFGAERMDIPDDIREILMAYQRLLRIKPDLDLEQIEGLADMKLDSASKIASLSAGNFEKKTRKLFGDNTDAAKNIYKQAAHIKMKALHLMGGIKDLAASPAYRGLKCNVAGSSFNFFKQLPSYTSLFGNMDYFETDPGQTIFSPAAYFFDIMRIVDEYITQVNEIPEGHTLQERRPDLFSLKLTPDNSYTEIPYQDIINEILEAQLTASDKGENAYHTLALAHFPFNLPFVKPMAEFRAIMDTLGISLPTLYAVMAARPSAGNPAVIQDAWREAAGLSQSDFERLTTPKSDEADVAKEYGYTLLADFLPSAGKGFLTLVSDSVEIVGIETDFSGQKLVAGDQIKIADIVRTVVSMKDDTLTVDVAPGFSAEGQAYSILRLAGLDLTSIFMERTGLDRDSLTALLVQNASESEQAHNTPGNFFINNTGETDAPIAAIVSNDPANPTTRLVGLTIRRLDRISRFVRLSRLSGFAFSDVQWIMDVMGQVEITSELIHAIGRIRILMSEFDYSLLDCTAWIVGPRVSGRGFDVSPEDQFDGIFNAPSLLQGSDPYAEDSTVPFHPYRATAWEPLATDDANTLIRTRLRAALSLGDEDLTRLVTSVTNQRPVELTYSVLSQLYRTTWASRVLGSSVTDALTVLDLLRNQSGAVSEGAVNAQGMLQALERFSRIAAWLKTGQISIPELNYFLTGKADSGYAPEYSSETITAFINGLAIGAAGTRLAEEDLNSVIPAEEPERGASEESFDLMDQLVRLGVVDESGIFLVDAIPEDKVNDLVAPESEEGFNFILSTKLEAQKTAVSKGLAEYIGCGTEIIEGLLAFSLFTAKLETYLVSFLTEVGENKAPPTGVACCIALLSRWRLPVEAFGFSAAEAAFITYRDASESGTASSGEKARFVVDLDTPTIDDAFNLSEYARIRDESGDKAGLLLGFFQEDGSSTIALAAATGWNETDITTLVSYFCMEWGPHTTATLDDVIRLDAVFEMNRSLGANAGSLAQLVHTAHTVLETAAGAVDTESWDACENVTEVARGIMNTRFTGPALDNVTANLHQVVSEACRSALLGHTRWQMQARHNTIVTLNELYAFLLLDVEMGPCFMTSRIAQGIASVQLYLQRCRMMLEDHIATTEISESWWSWIMNYRVWEANRKIFLYPENYLEPSLRNGESPEFSELRSELAQNALSKKNICTPFSNFISSLAALAELAPCGSFQAIAPDGGRTLYLVGRTRTEPYAFYLRTLSETRGWSNWEKIDATINSAWVSPAYYFDRLFLFWSQLEQVESSILKNDATVYHLVDSIHLQYAMNLNGIWTQPQTLDKSTIINTTPGIINSSTFTNAWCSKDNSYWATPRILAAGSDFSGNETPSSARQGNTKVTTSDNRMIVKSSVNTSGIYMDICRGEYIRLGDEVRKVVEVNNDTVGNECQTRARVESEFSKGYSNVEYTAIKRDDYRKGICVAIGPMVRLPIGCDCGNFPADADPYDFYTKSVESIKENTELCSAHVVERKTPISYADAIHISKDLSSIRFKMTTDAEVSKESPYTMHLERQGLLASLKVYGVSNQLHGALESVQVYSAADPIAPYWVTENSFVDHRSKVILPNINSEAASLISVGNMPSAVLFDNTDEAFLVRPDRFDSYNLLSDSLSFSVPPVSDGALRKVHVTAKDFVSQPTAWDETRFSFTRLTSAIMTQIKDKLVLGDIDAALSLESQFLKEKPFSRLTLTTDDDEQDIIPPNEEMDFSGAFGAYFWEVFFHCPFLVADQLNSALKSEEAVGWMKYIFNPTQGADAYDSSDSPTRFWRFKPFRDMEIPSLLATLTDDAQITRYNDDPFDPHAIAGLRHSAYAKAVVTRYVDIIIDQADTLFTQYTRESITQATNLYIHAQNLLGKKPASRGMMPPPSPKSYGEIRDEHPGESLPQFLIDLENAVDWHKGHDNQRYASQPVNNINAYFAVPENSEFLALWDRLEDRLYKIRHCMNIAGEYAPLALYAPPIDPRLLSSMPPESVGDIIATSITGSVPYYRFSYLLSKAQALCGQLSSISQALLSALEKRDTERLTLLTNQEEATLLALQTGVREQEIEDAAAQTKALEQALLAATRRYEHYSSLLANPVSAKEQRSLDSMLIALVYSSIGNVVKTAASIGYAVPQAGSPFAMTYGGQQFGNMLSASGSAYEILAGIASFSAQQQQILASFERREEDWELQKDLASYDVKQLEQQVTASTVRQKIACRNLEIHEESIRHNKERMEFMKSKFTNEQLYQWMSKRLMEVQYQTYTLAYQVALMAQRAFRYEFNSDRNFLSFTAWNSIYQGMGAAESLMHSLGQMEVAVLDYSRPLEIEKTVSLAAIDPEQLITLRNTGKCAFTLTEALFDYDFPGHYNRKIQSLSVSIPCVTGPYQNIKGSLTQTSNHIVLKADSSGLGAVKYLLNKGEPEPSAGSLRSNWNGAQSIVLSRGNNDTGVLSDDMPGERYRPFEGTGAVSGWELELSKRSNSFSFDSISDVIITVQYSARSGGKKFRDEVCELTELKDYAGVEYFDCRSMFYTQWQLLFAADPDDRQRQTLNLPIRTFGPVNIDEVKVDQVAVYFDSELPIARPPLGEKPFFSISLAGFTLDGQWAAEGDQNSGNTWKYTLSNAESKKAFREAVCAQAVTVEFDLANSACDTIATAGKLDSEKLKSVALILSFTGSFSKKSH